MKLITPSVKYKSSYIDAIEESKYETGITRIRKPKKNIPFNVFVRNIKEESKGLHLPKGYVPATELWLVDKNQFIGWANIRHSLTDHLLRVGGHIGYWIRPSERNKGYGTDILRLALVEAKKLGLKKVLVTCDDTNLGSRKIIESNGGILENIVENGKTNPMKRRYWIST